eukprot:c37534_g1_i1 orf=299-565(+)
MLVWVYITSYVQIFSSLLSLWQPTLNPLVRALRSQDCTINVHYKLSQTLLKCCMICTLYSEHGKLKASVQSDLQWKHHPWSFIFSSHV